VRLKPGPKPKLTDDQRTEVIRRLDLHYANKPRVIARELGVSQSTIGKIYLDHRRTPVRDEDQQGLPL
jgi:IS30 family transposase